MALCTHNRADLFAECLAALMPQLGPAFELIVDSASAQAGQEYFLRFWYNFGRLQETLLSPHPRPA